MKTVFHVGYPKAASTMLQKQLFGLHSGFVNLGLYPSSNVGKDNVKTSGHANSDKIPYLFDSRISTLYTLLSQQGGLEFDCVAAKSLWQEIANDYGANNSNGGISSHIVLSHEAVTSGRFSHPELLEKARRIREVFGHIKIIMIIRRQQEMLKSLFRDHPFDPRSLEYSPRPVSFREWLSIDLDRGPLSLARTLYFGRVSLAYEDLFGRDNVLVLPMELLSSDLPFFCRQISDFLGVDYELTYNLLNNPPINSSVTAHANKYRTMRAQLMLVANFLRPLKKYLRPLDLFVVNLLKNIGSPATITIDENQDHLLKEMFAEDNANLANGRGLRLNNLGYYL